MTMVQRLDIKTTMPVGKYFAMNIRTVWLKDQKYARWMLKQAWFKEQYPDEYYDLLACHATATGEKELARASRSLR